MTFHHRRSLLALRPVGAVHRLPSGSEACPLSLREIVGALPRRVTVPIVAAPLAPVARAALVAAREAGAVVGLALAPGLAAEPWFAAVTSAADEVAPGLPFFLSAEVRVEDGDAAIERARVVAHGLVEAGLTHVAIDVSEVALQRRAQAAAHVAGFAGERELAVECVLPSGVAHPDAAAAYVEEFEGWGLRADVLGVRQAAPQGELEIRAQLGGLAALSTALGGRALLRRGPLPEGLARRLRGTAVTACEDGGAALAAGLRALPPELRARPPGEGRRGPVTLPDAVADRLEALAYAEVAALLERLGVGRSADDVAAALARRPA
jgi:hypothetical protein